LQPNGKLRGGEEAVVGKTYKVKPPLGFCERGLHFSYRAIDAMSYANSNIITLVRPSGKMIVKGDKGCATGRTIVAGPVDVEAQLSEFSRWCALQVIHLWDCPPIVKQYLETGDETIRAAARDAAWDAARDAARDAAWDAARDAARAAARDAAWAAARDVKYDEFNQHLEEMLLTLMNVDANGVPK
jgi:hypothetical protein